MTKESSLTNEEILYTYITDHVAKQDKDKVSAAIKKALETGRECLKFRIGQRILFARIARISDRRVRMDRWDITGMEVLDIFDLL